MYDTEEIGALLFFVAQVGKERLGLHAQYVGKAEQGFDAGGVGAGFEAADGFGVKTGFFAKFSLSKPGYLAVAFDGWTQT
ncbi:hypothetical protein D3C71_1754440 [compost metagenome]